MTQFRPGQRVRVVGYGYWVDRTDTSLLPIGSIHVVTDDYRLSNGWWALNDYDNSAHLLELIPEPGIPGHLRPVPLNERTRHLGGWAS